jgi:hypothetical protein
MLQAFGINGFSFAQVGFGGFTDEVDDYFHGAKIVVRCYGEMVSDRNYPTIWLQGCNLPCTYVLIFAPAAAPLLIIQPYSAVVGEQVVYF